MQKIIVLLALSFLIFVGCSYHQETTPSKPTEKPTTKEQQSVSELQVKIEELIKQLSDDNWRNREKATKELIEIGKPAMPFLKKAQDNEEKELEVKLRLNKIIELVSLKILFVDILEARLQGNHEVFSSFFAVEGYDVDMKKTFELTDIQRSPRISKSREKVVTFENIVKETFNLYDLSEYKLENIIDITRIEVMTYDEAAEKYGETPRINRIFYKGAITPQDIFVIAPCKIAEYTKGKRKIEFNQLFFVGVEHNTDFIFYVFKKTEEKWQAVLIAD